MKTVVITGAASGMGLAATKIFLEHNWNVAMADYNQEQGQQKADELAKKYSTEQVKFFQTDVSDEKSVEKLAKSVADNFDYADALLNNAGVFTGGMLHEVKTADWDRIMNIDVKSIYLMAKYFVPSMIERKSGVIVNTASVSGLMGDYNMAAYNAAKGAVVNLVRSMALDYGQYGIRVNNVNPGPTNTPMFQQNPQSVIDEFVEASPMKKLVEPEDVAKTMYFLTTDGAKSITGQNIPVTAGFGVWSSQPKQ
ncbi:SDR family NAD(P)-dependent oxidoreductase [Companilactobacillus sp.]|jgi:meso-butanediol dehydrogenase/(S,S)-butanediol dehydrogenase/diacetyl reductase|uniref:SDR family NAD(P)-dependent oxidoreductase n=1 Tax=Companilactobacillus sp. TaxID=2767905 RepID=UPI0025BE32C3|nr:SDR family oxidoreductase [Companilactobacillus sp.]MCH4009300.1 SDR family oxidoreductase [Companilactobacillus sp.]MCH4050521.1 SDR family oxidoreductase [Companilactobacillus sp.]MCH4077242.1 SDR family oxidoreductase [Companilactobacillus sp.]MCH4125818.1 SDR family oxidoreductase [Companilactobacillus sp.]MCI1311527.1 SDR family oxidoreductase [Companilactobacillus sp.]